jgi:hypothetical protein
MRRVRQQLWRTAQRLDLVNVTLDFGDVALLDVGFGKRFGAFEFALDAIDIGFDQFVGQRCLCCCVQREIANCDNKKQIMNAKQQTTTISTSAKTLNPSMRVLNCFRSFTGGTDSRLKLFDELQHLANVLVHFVCVALIDIVFAKRHWRANFRLESFSVGHFCVCVFYVSKKWSELAPTLLGSPQSNTARRCARRLLLLLLLLLLDVIELDLFARPRP